MSYDATSEKCDATDQDEDKNRVDDHMSPVTSADEEPQTKGSSARARRLRKSKQKLNQEAHKRQQKRNAQKAWGRDFPGTEIPDHFRRQSPPRKREPRVVPPPPRVGPPCCVNKQTDALNVQLAPAAASSEVQTWCHWASASAIGSAGASASSTG